MNVNAIATRLGGISPIIVKRLKPMAEAEIRVIENDIGSRLPEPYRRFLATYGACMFKGMSDDNPIIIFRPVIPLPLPISSTGNGLFYAFYGSSTDDHDPYGLRVRVHYYMGRIPGTMIPIGDDGGGDQICLGTSGNDSGKVFYWDPRNEPLDEETYLEDFGEPMPPEAKRQNVHLIADSFEDFLNRLEMAPTE